MKKIQTILLSVILILTTCITMPVVSFAENNVEEIPSTAVSITPTVFEQVYIQNANVDTSGTTRTASAWFKVKPAIAAVYNFNPVNITAEESISSAAIKVVNAQGQPVVANTGKYALNACTGTDMYYIQLSYVLNDTVTAENYDVRLKASVDPVVINSDTSVEINLNESATLYYIFRPSTRGGYTFLLENLSSTSDPDYDAQVMLTNGTPLSSDFVKDGKTKSCALFLNPDSSYIIKISTEKVEACQLKLSIKSVFDGTTGAQITVNKNSLNVSDETTTIPLYCFQNKKISYWYRISVNETGYYEFVFNNKNNADSDDVVSIILHEDEQLLDELIDDAAFAGDGDNEFFVKLDKNINYYLQLRPSASSQIINLDVTFKKHNHNKCLSADDFGGVTYGCICRDSENEDYYYEIDTSRTKIPNIPYTGAAVTAVPEFAFEYYYSCDDTQPIVDPSCYTITYRNSAGTTVSAPKAIGSYTATIKFGKSSVAGSRDSLAGLDSIKKTFKVVPKATALSKVSAGTAGFTAKWDKRTSQVSGYQLQYSPNKNFGSAKSATITKNTTVSKKISKLKSARTYYVRVRTYKTVGKTKYYSAWSEVKTVKTK